MICVSSLSRHDGAWVRPDWRAFLIEPLTPGCEEHLVAWSSRNLPFVVARSQKEDPANSVRLGLSLPNRRRIGLFLRAEAVARAAPPPPLAGAVPFAPPTWREPMEHLDAAAKAIGALARVYGSLAWRFYSGDAYIKGDSDVDLLFAPTGWPQAEALLDVLIKLPEPPSWDGEFLLPDGWAVAWRELARRPPTVLLKGHRGLELRSHKEVFAGLQAGSPLKQLS
jgi:phosphoribosyl-dephospho-CoA transferase